MIRTLIVDDEPLARTAVRHLLHRHPDIETVGECESGVEASAAIPALAPHLVFLDVQMPEVDGFAVVNAIPRERLPLIIFVTAFDRHAVRAFDVHAVDYLLKPLDHERFDTAIARARQQLQVGPGCRSEQLDRLIVRSEDRVFFLPATDIDWIEAQGNYVNLHSGGRAYLFREAMATLEARLDSRRFRRIGRSAIVNIDSIRELRPSFHGNYEVALRCGAVVKLSHRYRTNLEKNALGGL